MSKKTVCEFCGQTHGPRCPSVKAIEYFASGKLKRVEFTTTADYMPAWWPAPVTVPPVTYPNPLQPYAPIQTWTSDIRGAAA